ncbi:MAG: hypothetical protein ACM3YN_08635 [Parcubacteria group bacterium]
MGEGPNDEQLQFLRDLAAGRICEECGDTIEPGEPCDTCADKAAILKAAFPKLYGDA